MSEIVEIMRAAEFAARKHTGHQRKGAAKEPYVNHVLEVAALVAEATGGEDAILVIAALLHDTVEDTDTTDVELREVFGEDVLGLVLEVTDDKSLPKQMRKDLQVKHAPTLSNRAKVLKIADKVSNLRSVIHSSPVDWDSERKRAYFQWAADVVAGCRGVNAFLEREFDEVYREGRSQLA